MEGKPNFKVILFGLIVGILLITVVVVAGYSYSQKLVGTNKVALPAGQNYLGDNAPDFNNLETPPTAPQRFTAAPDVAWKEFSGKNHPYSFNYPETLTLGVFPNDPTDSVAIVWGNIPAQSNILLNLESISERTPQYVGNLEEYVNNWWKLFPGLKGVKTVTKFTNTNGLVGYRAIFINSADQTPNVDVFFQVPNNQNIAIRLANGILDPVIFDRLVDSVKYTTLSPSSTSGNP